MKREPDLQTKSDEELMLAYGKGSAKAFDQLFIRHGQKVYNLFLRHTANSEIARDLAQETWTRLISARQRYQPTRRFSSWLYTIAMNLLRDEIKRRKRKSPQESLASVSGWLKTSETHSPEHKFEAREQEKHVRSAVQNLPEEQRAVIILARYQELSYAEVAEILGISEAAAKQRAWRALKSLKNKLQTFHGGKP